METEIINAFMDELKIVKIDACRNDEWMWLGDISNSFTVNYAYKILLHQNILQPHLFSAFNFDYFRSLKALPSTHYCKIATYDNLIHRGI